MKPILPSIALACTLLAHCLSAHAQSATDGSRSCRQVQDPTERLRCYDAQDAAANPTPAAPAAAAQAVPPGTPAAGTAVAPRSAPSAAPPAPAPAVASTSAKFGEETLPTKARPAPKPADNVLVATIRSIKEVRPKVFNIALANGQIWRQEGTTATVFFRAGADARIEKGLFGDYRMSTSTTGNGLWVRVTRIQ